MIIAALVTQPVAIFCIVLVIILAAPLLLNRLKIPHIIGMIVAGVVVGPYGFDILDRDSSFAIFGQVGLLYLMFLAGLEIDMFHLKLNLKRGLLFGLFTLLVPLILGVVTSVWLLRLDWLTSLLLGSMYASHTLIAYPVATRYGITRAPAVLIAIVGTIIAVIGALLVLGATISVEREGSFNPSALFKMLGLLAIYCLFILYTYPRLTRLFFKHVADKVTQYVYVLAMVFFAAVGAQLIGLEAVLGAFFAGLVLNRYVPSGSSLMASIEFVGNALFIPYFLISVGMMINVRVIMDASTLAVSGIMLAVALVSKWLPAYLAQRINRLSKASRGVMFGLTTAHTAVALAVVTLGFSLGMLSEQILNSTVLVILVTCALAPMFTASAAAKLKVEMLESDARNGADDMRQQRVNNTLISVGSPIVAQSLVDLAMLMRNQRGRHNYYAIHVRTDNSATSKAVSLNALETAQKAGAAANTKVETLDRYDLNVVTGIINAMNERDITEVIVGIHRRSTVIDTFLGNNIGQLLRATNKMVIITRCFIPPNTLTRIVVYVPQKAQYESGFNRWVRLIARLASQIGCRVIFCCSAEVQPLIRGIIHHENCGVRSEYRTVEQWDDFIVISNEVLDDDLFVLIGARANSVSYSSELADIPSFLQKYFSQNNLLFIYPEQFGEQEQTALSFAGPMSTTLDTTPSPLWRRTKAAWRRLGVIKKSWTHRNRKPKIDIRDADDSNSSPQS
ncbi:MAG: cation:proton antiporter [Bacteroidales bacterium]|nr:cation:proton antiporter [Bacteroidales bacterium]